ncbi:hypothetical protein BG006_008459 [Podila minutissima]|uniref:Uncharacterized protein n=1 Tax=Podila minutissima TaxID=64525 RepID=A0A9P5VJY9_9FUNG|nr:hypothetical protein BG006_008459 [Podila minutissima]
MKFSTVALLAAIVAVAAAQSSSGDGIITIDPIPGTTESTDTSTVPVTAPPTSATGVPSITSSGSVSAPVGTKTTTGTAPPPTKTNGGNALSSTSAKVLLAIGGGAAVLAQFL